MKYLASLLLIVSFIGISVFSLAIFDHHMNHSKSDCLAYTINGVICPTNVIVFALRHLIAIVNLLLILMLEFFLLVPISLFLLFPNRRSLEFNPSYRHRKFIRWLALLEHSPSFRSHSVSFSFTKINLT